MCVGRREGGSRHSRDGKCDQWLRIGIEIIRSEREKWDLVMTISVMSGR